MNCKNKLLVAGLALLMTTGAACAGEMAGGYEANYHDVVRDENGTPVRSSNGNCVRTKWLNSYDACGTVVAEAAPVVQPAAPVVQEVRKTVISQDERTVYFPFNVATLTPDAKMKLDTLARDIKSNTDVKDARIVGYADRIGSAGYNEKLSKKRADNVKNYLVSKGIIHTSIAETRWFGDSVPATNCPSNLKRSELISCLQKDRRVEVEVDLATQTQASR